jgi:3-phosphoshikimate 1-carboxyvinyltransferase
MGMTRAPSTRQQRRAPCHSARALSKAARICRPLWKDPSPVSSPIPPPCARAASCPGPLRGTIRVPGDKSISHRSIMLGALAVGESRVTGLLEGEDVLATAAAMRAMGARSSALASGEWRVHGVGVGALLQPQASARHGQFRHVHAAADGPVASHPITATFIGDASLSKRPMGRVIEPLSRMGADFTASPAARCR